MPSICCEVTLHVKYWVIGYLSYSYAACLQSMHRVCFTSFLFHTKHNKLLRLYPKRNSIYPKHLTCLSWSSRHFNRNRFWFKVTCFWWKPDPSPEEKQLIGWRCSWQTNGTNKRSMFFLQYNTMCQTHGTEFQNISQKHGLYLADIVDLHRSVS